jgi:hypothetical protein
MSLKYTLIQLIVIANPRAKNIVINSTGMAHNISIENGEPTIALIAMKTMSVGRNLKIAITSADIGSIIRGNAVLRIKRWPAVTDFTPPVRLFATR